MNQLLKTLLIIVVGFVGVVIFASVALYVFFDPNDYRDDISAGVKEVTGRDLTIEGDLSLSIFPWLAIEVGRTELGNAEGFGDEPFMRFEQASLSVRMLPLILSQETTVGTASIEGLVVNLQVAADGTSNWDDFSQPQETVGFEIPESDTEPTKIDFGSIQVSDANGATVQGLYPGYGWGTLPYSGTAPDMGAYEFGGENPAPLSGPNINILPSPER